MSGPRILVVRLSAIGDCVHAVPAVRQLAIRSDVVVGWAIEDAGWRTVRPLVPETVTFHRYPRRGRGVQRLRAQARFAKELRAGRYDCLLDLQGNAKSAWVGLLSGVKQRIGPADGREASRWLTPIRFPVDTTEHVVQRGLSAAEFVAARLGGSSPRADEPPPNPGEPAGAGLPAEPRTSDVPIPPHEGAVAVLCPATTWPSKHWPPERFSELCARLLGAGWTVRVFWGTEEERRLAAMVLDRCATECASETAGLAPELDLEKLADYFATADLVVGNDTGPVHLAAQLAVPTVSIHGPTPVWRNGAFGDRARGVERASGELACQPCWKRTCHRGDLACLQELTVDAVLSACATVLTRPVCAASADASDLPSAAKQ